MADSIVPGAGLSRAGLLPQLSQRGPQGQSRLRYLPVRYGRCGRRRVDVHHRRGLRIGKPLRLRYRRSVCGDGDLLRRPPGPLQCGRARVRVRRIGGQHPLQRPAERVCTGAAAPSGRVHGLRRAGRCGRRWRLLPDRLGSVLVYVSRRWRWICLSQSAARLCVVLDVRAGVRWRRERPMRPLIVGWPRGPLWRGAAPVLLATIVAACGSSGSGPGNVEAGGPGDDDAGPGGIADGSPSGDDAEQAFDVAPTDAPTDPEPGRGDAGAFTCGDTTCASGQLCIHPCCGGAAPSCLMPLPEAGTCPSNLVRVSFCPGTGRPGCQPPPCTPPPPFCVDANQCADTCGCASCGTCPPASGRDVMCLCA